MQKKNIRLKKFAINTDIILLCLCVVSVLFIIWTFTGQWPWKGNVFNSYILQTQSWLEGRLDLGRDYPNLELAIFNNKYFVSFPPFPSYVMLPFVFLGWDTCDGFIAFVTSIMGAVYAFKILEHFEIKKDRAVLFTLLLTFGSNWLFNAQNSWVWFIAQNMAFTLSLMAIYYALKGKVGLSLAFWACAVGCRPLQILYIPILLYILYKQHKKENPNDTIKDIIAKKYLYTIPMIIIALSYMILNYARFGNIVEFGHNYLPEFTRSEHGQFNITYMAQNIHSLFKLPTINSNGTWKYPQFNGMCIFIISPIFISFIIYAVRAFIKKQAFDKKLFFTIVAVVILELILTTLHKTMGGAHFGNRYTNDVLPLILLGIGCVIGEKSKYEKFNLILVLMGFSLNIIGSIYYYNNFFN